MKKATKKAPSKKVAAYLKSKTSKTQAQMPHIDPAWAKASKKAPKGSDSTAIVRCSDCNHEHEQRARRMFNGTMSECPKCGHKVYSTVSEPEPVQQKLGDVKPKKESKPKTATQRLRAGEAVSGDDLLKEFNERDAKKPKEQPEKVVAGGGVAVFVKWQPNGDVKRGILVAYNKLGKPMVRIARVDSHGAYTGEVAAKARTFEPEDVVGAVDGRTLGVATHNANYRTEPVSSSQVGTVTTLAPTEEKVPEVVIDYTKPQYAGELTPGVAVADAPRETVRMRELREAREKRIGTPSPTFVVKQKENAPVVDGNWGDMQPNAIAIVEDEERAPWE